MTMFPYRAASMGAEIEWLTSVTKSYTLERRTQLRGLPRLKFDLGVELEDQDVREASALVELGDGELSFPDWRYEQTIASGFAAAALDVVVDATWFAPAVGDSVVVWEDKDNFTETTVAAIVSNTVTLSAGPAVAYGAASIMPVLDGVVSSAFGISTSDGVVSGGSLSFVVIDYADLSSYFAGDEYDSKYVAGRGVLAKSQESSVGIMVTRVDVGIGSITQIRTRQNNDWGDAIQLDPESGLSLLEAEAIFHKLGGRLNPFWKPTWLPDFNLYANAPSAQSYIRVDVVPAGTAIEGIAIEVADGTKHYHEVLSWSSTASYTQINFTGFLSADVNIADVVTISLMRLSRLDTDAVKFAFNAVGGASVYAKTLGVTQ